MIVLQGRRLEERMLKIHQRNKKLLIETEVLDIKRLIIDNRWNFDLDPKYIKCKIIIGNVLLYLNHIPEWISNIKIDGFFNCSLCGLTSLKNCPKTIKSSFYCDNNKLHTLDDGPTYVGRDYFCENNSAQFSEEYVRSICNVGNKIYDINNKQI